MQEQEQQQEQRSDDAPECGATCSIDIHHNVLPGKRASAEMVEESAKVVAHG